MVKEAAAHFIVVRKQTERERKGPGFSYPSRMFPQRSHLLPVGSTS
jgi:hypothetical protein